MSNRKRRKKLKRRLKKSGSSPQSELVNGRDQGLEHKVPSRSDWLGPSDLIGNYIAYESSRTLEAYRSQPNLVVEHANHEEDTARGGYAHRQLFELVQNSADSLAGTSGGRIWIGLTARHLYCADEGQAIDPDGVTALMFSHLSPKRGTAEIGRFGLGFKSVLGVTDSPEFFSRSGSFRFDREKAAALIRPTAPGAMRYPVLRLPEAIDPWTEMEVDPVLRSLMGWAVNIVRLPLKSGTSGSLHQQIVDFPAAFLLFVEHVTHLTLRADRQDMQRSISLHREEDHLTLDDGQSKTRWMLVNGKHQLSVEARSDRRALDDATEVPLSWAAPIDRLNEPGQFWAFFPTMSTCLLSGILNAPWKTNEDRQNLLPGVYNDELIDAAAAMVAEALPILSSQEDPARHLDALPRRGEAGDSEQSTRLRRQLHAHLQCQNIVPDQAGDLRRIRETSFPPTELTPDGRIAWDAFQRWVSYEQRPLNWLNHSALRRNRLAILRRLMPDRVISRPDGVFYVDPESLPRATVAEWLEALVQDEDCENDAIEASMVAIQTAALIPESTRNSVPLGKIVLTSDNRWSVPDPDAVFLVGGHTLAASRLVHPQLEADADTVASLRKLGIRPASSESVLRDAAERLLAGRFGDDRSDVQISEAWSEFWQLTRDVDLGTAAEIIQGSIEGWRGHLRVRTIDGKWHSLYEALLPGEIVPDDGSRDGSVAIDTRFHKTDLSLLRQLGATDMPCEEHELSPSMMSEFIAPRRRAFLDRDLPRSPQSRRLNFAANTTSGPLDVLTSLSEEGKALYTWHLLNLRTTFERWIMRHDTQAIYPDMDFESPAVEMLRQHGRIGTNHGIRRLVEGLGNPPQDRSTYYKLIAHPWVNSIHSAFRLANESEMPLEPIGEDAPVPLLDVWPGLERFLATERRQLQLVRCDGFRIFDSSVARNIPECVVVDDVVYVTRRGEERREIRSVLRELDLLISDERIEWILIGLTPEDVQSARDSVRSCCTDEERLLAAVGEAELKRGLPHGLISILEDSEVPPLGIQVAEAAIATFHSGALREYRHALTHLEPPRQWAGRPRAVQFVRSLGFSEEWAGDSSTRRDPFVEVDGPYTLPELHDYQRRIVKKVRGLIRSVEASSQRRGMISMPTGSGKTRVAVQAIVESIREDAFEAGILWIADRDELCEQAVEAWRQVWSSEGAPATRLRISRMWAGQPQPLPTGEMHVVVATIQTLSAKISRQPRFYEFLADFKLLVFDEAHRSVAPTFTSVMEELGLTRWRRATEPLLLGLTATPYRGHDERETARLVGRYGGNRLDVGAFASDEPEAVIEELQTMRVLARADHEIIRGGEFHLSADEKEQSRQAPWLPRSVETRIASDAQRTGRIIKAYQEFIDPSWSTLIFATSVEHSQIIAALLTRRGIAARSVSGSTEVSVRRRVVEEFRGGRIKALVNYGVFREGFDAPRTRAIIVARPVYSPNLYFQMIGRGLRGVKNGGNDRCLILNVNDNIENFERKLAFSDLDWLWE